MKNPQPTILIFYPVVLQAQVWQVALASQGAIASIHEGCDQPLQILQTIATTSETLPDLVLVEISQLDNPYEFCRQCRSQYPTVKIFLISRKQQEVSPPELRWARFQGAEGLLPCFSEQSLLESITQQVSQVLAVVGKPAVNPETLFKSLMATPEIQILLEQHVGKVDEACTSQLIDTLKAPAVLLDTFGEPPQSLASISPADDTYSTARATGKKKNPRKPPDDDLMYRGAKV